MVFNADGAFLLPLIMNVFSCLMTHTAGFGCDNVDEDLIRWSKATNRKAGLLDWSVEGFEIPLKFTPGDGWYYGIAPDWAGLYVEAVTGQTLGDVVAENVLRPAGMNHTTFWPYRPLPLTGKQPPALADLMLRAAADAGGELTATLLPMDAAEHELETAGSGLFGTAGDHARLMQALLGGKLLGAEALDELFRPQLEDKQRAMLQYIANAYGPMGLCPELPPWTPVDHGLPGLINIEDVPGKRRAGSMMWSGMGNSRWVSFPGMHRSKPTAWGLSRIRHEWRLTLGFDSGSTGSRASEGC